MDNVLLVAVPIVGILLLIVVHRANLGGPTVRIWHRDPRSGTLAYLPAFATSIVVFAAAYAGDRYIERRFAVHTPAGFFLILGAVYAVAASGRPRWLLDWTRSYYLFMGADNGRMRIICGVLACAFVAVAFLLNLRIH